MNPVLNLFIQPQSYSSSHIIQLPLYIYLIAYTLGKCIYLGLLPGHEFATSAEGGSCFCLVFGRRATKNSGDFPPGEGKIGEMLRGRGRCMWRGWSSSRSCP